jgi:hypothetical protein
MDPAIKFLKFLKDHNIENVSRFDDNIMDLVSDNYDSLTNELMRAMVDCALAERDANLGVGGDENDLLGSWGVIIDTFKEQTMLRRERAGAHLQQLVAFGLQGGGAVQEFIDELCKKGHVDSVLIDLVGSSLADVDKHPGNDHIKNVLRDVFTRIKPAAAAPSKDNQMSKASTVAATARVAPASEEVSEKDLMAAGNQLRLMVQRNSGDANKLRAEVSERMRAPPTQEGHKGPPAVSLTSAAFQKVLDDNIAACREVGYANKTKFLEFLKQTISTTENSIAEDLKKSSVSGEKAASGSVDHFNHSPQFVDDSRTEIHVSLVEEDDTYIDITNATEALSISATGAKPDKQGGGVNKKKKSLKAANKKKVSDTAAAVGAHLEEFGWAVCDHAVPMGE